MRLLNIVTSPRRERSASIAVIDSFLFEYQKRIKGVVVDTLDVWTESLPEFDAEAIGAKYKGVSGEAMTSSERATWEKIRELASRFQKADHIVLDVPMWNFSFPYKLKQLIDLACQRNMLFTFDGKEYGPALNIDKVSCRLSRAGLPGISIPIGLFGNGLPIGLEIDGQSGRDRCLLHLARCVELAVCAMSPLG
jgi:FMN-dependent NADH-azoreductase